ncbi:hypothetical protein KKG48_00495 [Patescibacteria group bacterium]|nr:hypothetical protein [Patescibacteria group bacterium]MCG2694973.1 hypothetical protein [Candidatus Parcubacteria bacterium]
MILTFFIFSLIGLTVFFSWKIWEDKTGKVLISKNKLNKSDIFFKDAFKKSCWGCGFLLNEFFRLIFLGKKLIKISFIYLIRFKKIVSKKFFKLVKIDEKMKLNRNRGSVSFFLRTMSEEKERSRRDN